MALIRKVCGITLAMLVVLLSACGGGGDGGSGTNSSAGSGAGSGSGASGIDIKAVGRYYTTVDVEPQPIFQTLVISPNGKMAIYYEDSWGFRRGFVDGNVTGSGGQFTGRVTDFGEGTVEDGTISGQYRSGGGVSAQFVFPSGSPSIDYAFEAYMTGQSGAADSVGSWNAVDEFEAKPTVVISNDSKITVTFSSTCTVSGTLKFSDGANTGQIATLNGVADGTGCRFGTGSMSGLMIVEYPNGRYVELTGHFVRSDRREGFSFTSTRCPSGKTVRGLLFC